MLQSRVRTAQYREIESRRKSGRLKGLLFVHLKKDLEVDDRDWVGCRNPKELSEEERRRLEGPCTSYGILKRFQRAISNIRTDLDSFNDVEGWSLMASGYQMANSQFDNAIQGFPTSDSKHDWAFGSIIERLGEAEGSKATWLSKLLDVASIVAFKVWLLSTPLKVIAALAGIAALAVLAWIAWAWNGEPSLTAKGLSAAVAMTALTLLIGRLGLGLIVKIIQHRKTVHQILVGAGLSLLGTAASWVHLTFFDPLFLKKGEVPPREDSRQ